MGVQFSMQILFEVFLVLLIVYGYKHENDLIEFETILKQYAKKKIRSFKHERVPKKR